MSKLLPVEQKMIAFQGEELTAVLVQDADGRENVYVPLRPLVEAMGLNWSGQYQRIKKNPVLNDVCTSVGVTQTQVRYMLSIPISHLNGFLFGINANRVKEELRPLIIEYQRECYRVLFEAFNGTESMTRFYRAIGHEGKWIEKRIEKHTSSTDLSDVWLQRGIPIEHHDALHDVINKGTFDLTVSEHKQFKSIPEDMSLHDNMTRIELLISALADEAAIYLANKEDASGYDENEQIAHVAGKVGKDARKVFEEGTGAKVLSEKNHLDKGKRPFLKDE